MKHSLTSGSIWRGMLFFALPILLRKHFPTALQHS